MFALSAAVILALAVSGNAQNLGKPVLFTDGLSPHVDASFWAHLNPTQSTWDQWGWGWIPQSCFDAANSNNVSPYDFEVFNVHYTDCGTAWVFCRHHSASLSQIDMIDLFGRLPVHERQWIRHVVAVPGGGSAYELNADVVFQGPVGTPSVFQHEVGHAVDFYKNGFQSSGTSQFLNAIQQDSCVPDDYANSNNVEDYTQVGVLSLYEIVNPGGLDPIGANWRCLVNQKNVLDGFQRDNMIPGGVCDRRWADSTIVKMGPAVPRVKRGPVGPIPQPAGLPVPGPSKAGPDVYKNLVFNATEKRNAETRQAAWQKAAKGAEA
ncbi:hypothetical protein EXIGLDRAFT_726077 [Exidia glandulosa HHB12029]|uniref:Conidiation-specific protein 13 n=1 Tax=Exidia glandulosa HHB12029 TaxID=1314781 RepID=A0A165DW69_EXIGL|nr:hypothetical protein EXIGLDRAFT_726077 [Exidia glandulosa HHB12029]